MRFLRVLPLLILVPLVLHTANVQAQPPRVGNCNVFPADHVWNTPIDTLPVDPSSATYVNTIGASKGLKADFGAGLWDGGPIGIPFTTAPGSQAKYPASFDYDDESDPGPYAVPLNAPIEGGSQSDGDRHAISIDRDNCVLYELYYAFPGANSWQAGSGAIYDLKGYGLRPKGWTSADAAGLPVFAGLVRYDEILAGEITHAIRFTVPQTRNTYIWPARHKASSLTGSQYPPMGQRFRLKADFDISGFSPTNQVILKALKKYGMILADNGSAWYMSGAPDDRWDNSDLNKLKAVLGSNLEAIDESSLMLNENSGQARQTAAGISVGVTPASASLAVGGTRQFSASVSGSSNQGVTWLVNGVAGGNSSLGTVSSSGLYTAPAAVPSPATINVQARSVADTSKTGSGAVTITAASTPVPAPVITAINPGTIRTGSFEIVVTGSGFQNGAVVKLNGGSLTTTFNSSTQLTARGNVSATSSGTPVTVTNPDGRVSNQKNVVVKAPVTVKVSPTSASLRVRTSRQFTATVSNATNTAVVWKVNGIVGGNSTVGTISSSGLYTAPASVPSPGKVTITATSVESPAVSGTATVSIRWF